MADEQTTQRAPRRALPGTYFTSTAIFAREMQQIFARRWLYTVHHSALAKPGSYVLFELAPERPGLEPVPSESVLIVRGDDGEIRAFYNVCRHRGVRLRSCGGQLPSKCIRCPYHAWTYGLDGRLLGAPYMASTPGFDRSEYSLIPVATRVWEGLVFINLDPDPVPFEQAFASILTVATPWQISRLVVAERITYDVAANWKLIAQNEAECYHCPMVHPKFNQLSPVDAEIGDGFANLEDGEHLGGPMRIVRPGGSLTESGEMCGPRLVSGPETKYVHYYMIFPSMSLSLHPDYVLTQRLEPLGIARTRITCEWLFDPGYRDNADFDPHEAVALWDRTNREDWPICELTQQGVRSRGFVPGPYSELESVTAAFDRAYLEALGLADANDRE